MSAQNPSKNQRSGQRSEMMNGRVALVTGAASGIGRATALAFAEAGADVVVADTQEVQGIETARQIEALGRRALFVRCDVSSESDIVNLIDRTVRTFGRLDYAFNNAGTEGLQGNTIDCTSENFDRVIAVNLKGVWLCMKHQIPHMLKQGGGAIVNCSSIAGMIGFPNIPAYTASKHAVLGLTKAAALEFAKKGIRINAVCPGVIQTPMIDRFVSGNEQARAALAQGEPIGRVGVPEEIASAVVYLCSDGASFITGHPLVVDGGWVAQ